MGLKAFLEQIERGWDGSRKRSRKKYKNFRNRWLRRTTKEEIPNTKYRNGWEY